MKAQGDLGESAGTYCPLLTAAALAAGVGLGCRIVVFEPFMGRAGTQESYAFTDYQSAMLEAVAPAHTVSTSVAAPDSIAGPEFARLAART